MNDIIIGNICSLGAMVTDSISSTRQKHSEILAVQILSQFIYSAGSIILKDTAVQRRALLQSSVT